MRKFILLSFITLAFLCSCFNDNKIIKPYDVTVYDSEEIPYIEDKTQTKYIMSISGSTYHLESCYIVKNMKEENKREFYGKQFFIEREISPCKRCNP